MAMKPAKVIQRLPSSQKTTPVPPQHSIGKPFIIAIITIAAVIGLTLLLLNTDRLAGKATLTTIEQATQQTFTACVPLGTSADSLIAWWPGENAKEIGGNDGVLVGGVTFGTGKVGKAFSLASAQKQYITADPVSDLMTGNEFSFGAWVKPIDSNRAAVLAFNAPSGNRNMIFWSATAGSYKFSYFDPTPLGYKTLANSFSLNEWHHVMVTIDSLGKGHLYVDGGNDLGENLYFDGVSVRPAPGDRFSIGQEWDSVASDFFNGPIDEVMIFNKALTASQVKAIYDAGSAGMCKPICGDAKIQLGEKCDDDSTASGDGCSSTCQVESGFTCTGQPSVCTADSVPSPEPSPVLDHDLDGVPDDADLCPGTSDATLVYSSIAYPSTIGCYFGDIDHSGCVAPEEYTLFKAKYKQNAENIQSDLSPGDYTLYKAKYKNGAIPACS